MRVLFICRQNLKSDRIKLLKDKKKFLVQKGHELGKLKTEKSHWENNIKMIEDNNCKESDILDIDVGGTHKFTTLRSTLIKVTT